MKLSIVIPIYNEGSLIPQVLDRVLDLRGACELFRPDLCRREKDQLERRPVGAPLHPEIQPAALTACGQA